jgi:hypothetical protein
MDNLAYQPGYETLVKEFEKTVLAHYKKQKEFLPAKMTPVVPRSKWDIQFPFKPWEKTKALK